MKIIGDIRGDRILFLQGPMGNFFYKLGKFFTSHGATVYTICFNSGDVFFSSRLNRFCYKEEQDKWPEFIGKFIHLHKITKIFLFGNCRHYHREAIRIANAKGIKVYVFEEGYIRPNYITLELNGVNGDSGIIRDPMFYHQLPKPEPIISHPARNRYYLMAACSVIYYILLKLSRLTFPHYKHHRSDSIRKEMLFGIRNAFRKILYRVRERHQANLYNNLLHKKFYFVPLQTRTDYQVKVYSPYTDVECFIRDVLTSFSIHAPKDSKIVIKHHPMERGMPTYEKFIFDLAEQLDVSDRVLTIHDVHLPTCLINAKGTVTINSTVGLSSLFHNIPTIVLGSAVYDIPGLTCHNMPLDRFWTEGIPPNRLLFNKYKKHIIENTQLNGGFFGMFPDFKATHNSSISMNKLCSINSSVTPNRPLLKSRTQNSISQKL